jgi:formiminotetrahydrofolate cyclodeaminase
LNHSPGAALLDVTLGELLGRLGSSDPTPGGGAAAALVGALAAALVEMTANLTLGRPRFAAIQDRAEGIQQASKRLADQLGRLADEDARAFAEVSAAYKLPRRDQSQQVARAEAIQRSLAGAAAVPMQTARLARDVLGLADTAAPILNAAVISDVMVGAWLAHAALEGAAINVEVNLAAMTDAPLRARLTAELESLRAGAEEQLQRIQTTGRARFVSP